LVAKGLNSELILIPNEKFNAVHAALESDFSNQLQKQNFSEDPWQGLLKDDQK